MKMPVKILDRYVIRNFLYSYLLCFLVLMGLRIAADLFINMDEFLKEKQKVGLVEAQTTAEKWTQTAADITQYYSYQSLMYFQEMGGIIVVAAAAFSLARMNQTNELTAVLASGVSLHRVIWPILLVGMFLSGLGVLDQEIVIPAFRDKLVRMDRDDIPGNKFFQVRLSTDSERSAWFSGKFSPGTGIMETPLVLMRDERYKAVAKVTAVQAQYLGGTLWRMQDAKMAMPSDENYRSAVTTELVRTGLSPQKLGETGRKDSTTGRTVAIDQKNGFRISAKAIRAEQNELIEPEFQVLDMSESAVENPRVLATVKAKSAQFVTTNKGGATTYELHGGEMIVESDLTPDELALRQHSRWLEYMSTSELNQLLRSGKFSDLASASLAKHSRFTEPLANVIMLILGLPFILSRERNIKASASLCLAIVGACYISVFLSRYMGSYGLDPTISAWLPVLVFGPIGVVMIDTIKT